MAGLMWQAIGIMNASYVYANFSKAPKELQAKLDPNNIPAGIPHSEGNRNFDAPNLKDPLKSFNVMPQWI